MIFKKNLLLVFLSYSLFSYAQVGIGTVTPDPSALLDLVSTDSGLLLPRINLASNIDVTTIPNPADGLMVYSPPTNANVPSGVYIFNNSKWLSISELVTLTDNGDGTYLFSNGVDTDVTIQCACSGGGLTPFVTSSDAAGSCNLSFQKGETRDVTIIGDNFDINTTVSIAGQTVNSVTANSSTEIIANVTAGMVIGLYDIVVSNGSNSATLTDGFEVNGLIAYSYAVADMTLTSHMTYDGTTLKRISGVTQGWNQSGYSTVHDIPGNDQGYLEFTAGVTNKNRLLGLNADPASSNSYTNIDLVIYLRAAGNIQIFESGTSRGLFGAYSTGDVFKVNKSCDGEITYLKNGVVCYTSTFTTANDLFFDSSFNTNDGDVSDIKIAY